jgi:hypothetical protein
VAVAAALAVVAVHADAAAATDADGNRDASRFTAVPADLDAVSAKAFHPPGAPTGSA